MPCSRFLRLFRRASSAILPIVCLLANAQQERHGRGYKPPPPTANVMVIVEKAVNGKPMASTSVIFRAVREEEAEGSLEMKTDSEGRASIDLLEVGSHVTVQVIAPGFATYASEFDLPKEGKQLVVKLQRPRAQVSTYGETSDQAAEVQPGVQEHHSAKSAPTAGAPTPVSPTGPLQTTPLANTPATTPNGPTPPTTPHASSPQ